MTETLIQPREPGNFPDLASGHPPVSPILSSCVWIACIA